ncbi:MAG: hypothetical protein VR68_15315 [Peptococcaceae bacterium BRH_c4a]|nr:MAG: hypothetical protein VR68_15315 [Peptococcaceae bacterium BRH_c4a]
MKFPRCVWVVEVGPRDGLQNEPFFLNTELKAALINHLIKSGFSRMRGHMSGFWKNLQGSL